MHLLARVMLLLPLATGCALSAQQVVAEPGSGRKASTVVVQSKDATTEAAVSVSFSQPVWRSGYDELLPQLTGAYTRLGNGWWTTFDSIGALELGGVRIAAGSYFVGLARAADGAFSLLLFDSRKAMQARLLPYTTALYRGEVAAEFTVPLTFANNGLAASEPKLELELVTGPDDPARGRLSIRRGKHELSAPLRLELAAPPAATEAKK